jgi:pimeloyl-ACP methyl ester carboxylesterase
VLAQQPADRQKVYSPYEPQVYCLSKGKEPKQCEFGSKVSVVMTKTTGVIVGAVSHAENLYDGDALRPALEQTRALTGRTPAKAIVDRGHRGHQEGDQINLLLAAAAWNLRKWLRPAALFLASTPETASPQPNSPTNSNHPLKQFFRTDYIGVPILMSAERSTSAEAASPQHLTVAATTPARGDAYPAGTQRINFTSAFDGREDWALFLPGDGSRNTVVYLHGSSASAGQIFTRKDVREFWLKRIGAGQHPLLSVNMRGTSYMSPAATADLTGLLDYCREKLGCGRFVLLGGSGAASSTMACAVLHPEKVHGVVAMGMCDILAQLEFARKSRQPVLQKLVQTVFAAYGGTPEEKPDLYRARAVLAHTGRLTMSVILTMGENDAPIPVAETRKIAAAMKEKKNFTYHEVPKGDHDSALWVDVDLETLQIRQK